MIMGIGTDLCRVDRIGRAVGRGGFRERVFSREEIEYAEADGRSAEHYAASFAAKEALAKALGIGIFRMGPVSAWVERTETGPVMRCCEELSRRLSEMGVSRIWLSLTHEGGMALAFAVLEG